MTPVIELNPSNVDTFLNALVKTKKAKRVFYLTDNSIRVEIWNANKITKDSNLFWNIKTNHSYIKYEGMGILKKVYIEVI
jgi:hypothetical protein